MNVVGIRVDNGSSFESLSYVDESKKTAAEIAIKKDAEGSNIEIRIECMDDDELQEYIKEHSVD